MKEILGSAKTLRALLKGVKYDIDYYQREYKWQEKQVAELLDDLSGRFLEDFEPGHPRERVADYGHYFLGSIIVSKKEGKNYIVDGQQRLTTLSLLLIFLRNLQRDRPDQVAVDELIYSERFGKKSFNLDVEERLTCMEALFEHQEFDATEQSESVQHLAARYDDIAHAFPEELRGEALPYFIDWLIENVHLVEITAYSDEDAYTIFETMNDRGLSLSPTDMLKGYILSNITDPVKRTAAASIWKDRLLDLAEFGKEEEADFFKAWLRSQYATKIRERHRGARPEDFDQIGTEYHRWIRDAHPTIGLTTPTAFYTLVERDFRFYSRQYLRLLEAAVKPTAGLEHVLYNAQHGFTLQHMVLLAPLCTDDSDEIVLRKLRIVAMYLDILLTRRLWNYRSIAYSTMQYAMFLVMRDIRHLAIEPLALKLRADLQAEPNTFQSNPGLGVHQQNRWHLHQTLARMADWVERKSGLPPRYAEYVNLSGTVRYEVEHIWADKFERHQEEFNHPAEFAEFRNRIGGLLLLPKSFNASYGALTYSEKLPHYNTQNLLARSLHPQSYEHNPGFLAMLSATKLPFHAHAQFKRADLEERSRLYAAIAEQVWDPDLLLEEAGLERPAPAAASQSSPESPNDAPSGVGNGRLTDADLREARRPKQFDVLLPKDEHSENAPWTFAHKGEIRNAVVGQAYERAGIRYRIVTLEDGDDQVVQEVPIKFPEQQRSINPFQAVLRARQQHREAASAHSA